MTAQVKEYQKDGRTIQLVFKPRDFEVRIFDPLPVGFASYHTLDSSRLLTLLNTGYLRDTPENLQEYKESTKGYPRNRRQRLYISYTNRVGFANFATHVFIDEDNLDPYTVLNQSNYPTLPIGTPFSRDRYEFLLDVNSGLVIVRQKDTETGETKILRTPLRLELKDKERMVFPLELTYEKS